MITEELIEKICKANLATIKTWKAPEIINVSDAMHLALIEHHFGKPLRQALDQAGNEITDIPQMMDGSVVRGLVEGAITAADIDGVIVTREKILHQVLSEKYTAKFCSKRYVMLRDVSWRSLDVKLTSS